MMVTLLYTYFHFHVSRVDPCSCLGGSPVTWQQHPSRGPSYSRWSTERDNSEAVNKQTGLQSGLCSLISRERWTAKCLLLLSKLAEGGAKRCMREL